MTRRIAITPEHAHIPSALSTFMLKADKPLPYRWWTRLADHRAGRRDRINSESLSSEVAPVVSSPWLQRQLAECDNAIAYGRTRAEALVAVLDRELAALAADAAQQDNTIETLTARLAEATEQPITDAVIGSGEHYSSSDERLQRRHLERAQRLGALRQELAAAEHTKRELARQSGVIEQERLSHWVVLQERSRQLIELYQRRICTYTRGMEKRRKGVVFTAPSITAPEWVIAELGSGGFDKKPVASIRQLIPAV